MPFQSTPLAGLYIFEPRVFADDRGYFFESYNENTFREAGIETRFVQDNQSKSTFGVLRGLHYQLPPHAQAKLVRVLQGEVLDVAVDIREGSKTFGQHFSAILNDKNHRQLFIPRGFAHGFLVLSQEAIFSYKCDNFYNKAAEGGIRFDDPQLAIDWTLPTDQIILSEKDEVNPLFGEHRRYAIVH